MKDREGRKGVESSQAIGAALSDPQQLSRVALKDRLLLRVRTRQRLDFVGALPIAEKVRKVGAEHKVIGADSAPEKVERIDVIDQRVEIKILQIGAGRGGAARGIGPVGAAVVCR